MSSACVDPVAANDNEFKNRAARGSVGKVLVDRPGTSVLAVGRKSPVRTGKPCGGQYNDWTLCNDKSASRATARG